LGDNWIGVDLDGTLARTDSPRDDNLIGYPVPAMVERVRKWLDTGYTVKVFTARMSGPEPATTANRIARWTLKHIGTALEATCVKDYNCIAIWDDIAVTVEENTGRMLVTAP
jgi:hypothetical protein